VNTAFSTERDVEHDGRPQLLYRQGASS